MNRPPLILERLHIEASSRSRAENGYAIRAAQRKHGLDHDLPLAVFYELLGAITAVSEIRFHGWGDPLGNPDILPMLAAAKKSGARVVLVTDAVRFTDDHANALVRDGIDSVVFPLAGLTEESNFRRRGTSLFAAATAIKRLHTVQAVHQSALPEIAARYTLTRSGLASELDALPDFLTRLGVQAVAMRPLSYATSPETECDTLVPDTQEAYEALADRLRRLAGETAARGIRLDSQVVYGGQSRFRCPDIPGSAFFVAADGALSPCPLCNVPVAETACYRFHGQDIPFPHDVRGNLHTTSLPAIWNAEAYKEFRYQHDTGTPPAGCADCWRSFLASV